PHQPAHLLVREAHLGVVGDDLLVERLRRPSLAGVPDESAVAGRRIIRRVRVEVVYPEEPGTSRRRAGQPRECAVGRGVAAPIESRAKPKALPLVPGARRRLDRELVVEVLEPAPVAEPGGEGKGADDRPGLPAGATEHFGERAA